MSLQVSTKFKELILGTSSFESIFNGGRILIYSGGQPISADHAALGTLLSQITADGLAWVPNGTSGGLLFERFGALVSKNVAQNWRMKGSVAGTASWWRLVGPGADTGTLSYSAPRIDGSVGITGAFDMTVESTAVVAGDDHGVQQFIYTIPPVLG